MCWIAICSPVVGIKLVTLVGKLVVMSERMEVRVLAAPSVPVVVISDVTLVGRVWTS